MGNRFPQTLRLATEMVTGFEVHSRRNVWGIDIYQPLVSPKLQPMLKGSFALM
jgi:hypothetical protein